MGDQVEKGDEFFRKAEKKLNGWSVFSNKYEDAAELYEKAANAFKLAKSWDKAGETYVKMAEIYEKLDSIHEAANAYASAGKNYKKTNPEEAVNCLSKAVDLFKVNGRLDMAARICKEIAEIYEKDKKIAKAIVWYARAADLFEDQKTTANQCKEKIAQFSAELENYKEAIDAYVEIAQDSVNNNLLKYGVRKHLLNAGICELCKFDVVAITNALERYQELDPTFSGTREYKLLRDLTAALDEEDVVKFTDAVKEYDSMTPLDPWRTTLLLRVKESIKAKELEEDDLT
ncbi:unnamed protein product [Cuscuta epithymum]|uniref:Alpha-soluble NSF attachment protein n=1 Tax=Cuscuta epithymum TaxID=186058 RepID=A0AAV0C4M3_9ASTE|nr:unnamed protein product [Cuscuta epithymum]